LTKNEKSYDLINQNLAKKGVNRDMASSIENLGNGPSLKPNVFTLNHTPGPQEVEDLGKNKKLYKNRYMNLNDADDSREAPGKKFHSPEQIDRGQGGRIQGDGFLAMPIGGKPLPYIAGLGGNSPERNERDSKERKIKIHRKPINKGERGQGQESSYDDGRRGSKVPESVNFVPRLKIIGPRAGDSLRQPEFEIFEHGRVEYLLHAEAQHFLRAQGHKPLFRRRIPDARRDKFQAHKKCSRLNDHPNINSKVRKILE
jgi:hypothetical protein